MQRVGIIGMGGAGLAQYTYFCTIPGCTVTKIYDPEPEGRERGKALHPDIVAFDDLDAFFKDLDVVAVCTPDASHADYIVASVEAGCHVITEKPLTDSIEGIRKIKEAENKSDCVIACQHQMRFVPVHLRIKEALEAGEIGKMSYLEGYYVHDMSHRPYVASRYHNWRKDDNATPLVYSGCHFVDILRWFAEEEPEEVYAMANNISFPDYPESDLNLVSYRWPSGVIGKVVVAFGAGCPQDHSVKIYGSEGAIENNVLFKKNNDPWPQSGSAHWARTLHKPQLLHKNLLRTPAKGVLHEAFWQLRGSFRSVIHHALWEPLRRFTRFPEYHYGARFYPMRLYEHRMACVDSIEDFMMATREPGRKPICTVDEAAKTVLACVAGVESYRTGKPVTIPKLADVL